MSGGGRGVLGAGQGDGYRVLPGCERRAELFEHSFKHPGVVGRNVLTLSFNFQSKDFFFFFQHEFRDSLKNVPFLCLCILLSAPSHTKEKRAKG